ncbi:NYN domain-containing protein [Streptomyces sp. NP160]|uniref:NYN domain-containing protein n=1 Tax=Streptomyces sp. NP160 TaxID=2586637 RepID=UPI00214A8CCB|nr:NYN domain-containing protein [Streptomyces sp. NP160]
MAASESPGAAQRMTYLLVDGENIDATLGMSVLGRRPAPGERPRWDRVRDFAAEAWGQPVRALFFLNATSGSMPMSFVQALLAMDYRPIPLAGGPGEKVVDLGIQRTLDAIADRPGDVLLASHDGDFTAHLRRVLETDGRRVGLLGFREFVSSTFGDLVGRGLQVFDLEDHVHAFTEVLPRVRVIPLSDFDPERYL